MRGRLKTGKRLRVGRFGLEVAAAAGSREPRPVNVELTLQEDPSLLRLLKLGERLAHQREAGFCTSDEEGDFTGFQAEGRRPLRLGQDPPANKVTTKVKGLRATTESDRTSVQENVKRKGGTNQNVGRTKLVVKLAANIMTSKNLSNRLQLNETFGHTDVKKCEKDQEENREVKSRGGDDITTAETEDQEMRQKRTTVRKRRRRNRRVVWNLALIRKKAASLRLKPPDQKKGAMSAPLEVIADENGKTSLRDSYSPEPSHVLLKRPRSVFGNRRGAEQVVKGKTQETLGQTEGRRPRKRRRLVYYTYETVESAVDQVQRQRLSAQVDKAAVVSQLDVASARPSRVIKVPRRFMDDEKMSGIPVKKTDSHQNESCQESVKRNLSQSQFGVRKRRISKMQKPHEGDNSLAGKPDGEKNSEFSDGPRKKVVRPAYDSSHLKIYERLKKLTASLAQRKEQRMANARAKVLSEKPMEETQGPMELASTSETQRTRTSEIKIEDLNSPGVVRKVAIHGGDVCRQSALCSGHSGGTKDCVESTSPASADVQGRDESNFHVLLGPGTSNPKINLSRANKRMLHLLKRAKVQLIKIDQQKQLKSAQLMSGTVKVGDGAITSMKRTRRRRIVRTNSEGLPQGHLVGGPRIKHVCRAAAVALGQPRALVPDDIPRLSALPLHEREGIAPSPDAEDLGSLSETESTGSADQRPVYRRKPFGLRQHRCFRCKGCYWQEDCGTCVFCLDKPKFGGPNKKRQSCIYKKCLRIEENKLKRLRVQLMRRKPTREETHEEDEARDSSSLMDPANASSPVRRQPRRQVPRRCFSNLLESDSTDTEASSGDGGKEQSSTAPSNQANEAVTPSNDQVEVVKPRRPGLPKGFWARRRLDKLQSCPDSRAPALSPTGTSPTKLSLKLQLHRLPLSVLRAAELSSVAVSRHPVLQKAQEKEEDGEERVTKEGAQEQVLTDLQCLPRSQSSAEHTTPSVLAALANGFVQRERPTLEAAHKIRVDFKEDCNIQNVWAMGGLSILTSVPITLECLCLLCASKGHHDFTLQRWKPHQLISFMMSHTGLG